MESYLPLYSIDISPEEIGRNKGDAELGIVGDVNVVVSQFPFLCARIPRYKVRHSLFLASGRRRNCLRI